MNEETSGVIKCENGLPISLIDHTAQLRVPFERLLPHELELRNAGAEGVWTKTAIPRGTKYGPYNGKWLMKPIDMRFAWEVSTKHLHCILKINMACLIVFKVNWNCKKKEGRLTGTLLW